MSEDAPIAATATPPRQGLVARWAAIPLWVRILAGLVLGAIVGLIWGEGATSLRWVGDVFVRLIRMLVAPLIFVTIASGVAAIGDPKRLGSIGGRAIGLYVFTTAIAVTVGLTMGTLWQPGAGADLANAVPRDLGAIKAPADIFLGIIPANPIEALANGDTLAIIFFAIFLGCGVIVAGDAGKPVEALLNSASEVMLKLVGFVMEVAPFGVFALIAVVMGTSGPETFLSVFKLALCVLSGAVIQTLLVHGGLIRLAAWLPPLPFFRGVMDAIVVGFSTSSSSATLPVAIRVAEQNLGIKPSVTSTVLPLGATIGMDGAAMYVAMLTMFAAQAFGIPMGPETYLVAGITTVLVAMGIAPVPSGSLFVLAAVLAAIGATPAQTAILVGFILPFDRILDMIRTIPNVTADLAIATTVARWEGEIDVAEYQSARDV
ncbi:dicarboxylate/amino acid:cation symporter [Sphingomonas sp.]|uniref:dicarboxylate/amino acid:cation symporter n=1 Tax=Sphingomonas sp. TaxID=28214 RepID=UPI00260075A3|nr:dicarboxylate/amino acid:cation symporter [Sphingomonas sp.]